MFLGLAGHFRAFVKDYALKAKCLTRPTQKDVNFDWTKECDRACCDMVQAISLDPIVSLPDFTLLFYLNTDASQYGTGAVLYQCNSKDTAHKQLCLVGYFGYRPNKSESNYLTTEKDALAVLKAVRYFYSYLEGATFKPFTDHQSLTLLLRMAQLKVRLTR